MQFEKIIKIMHNKKIGKITGPNVSYTYNHLSKNFFIHSTRGRILYSRELIEEPLYRDMLKYIVTGKISKNFKLLSGTDSPYINGYDKISTLPGDNTYNVLLVRGNKRTAYLVKATDVSKRYYVRLGPEEIYFTGEVFPTDHGSIEVYWDGDLIYTGKSDYDVLKLAVDMEKQKLIKKMIPFLTEDYIVHANLTNYRGDAGSFEYENNVKHVKTNFWFDEKKNRYVVTSVIYKEGLFSLFIPVDYDGPDPLKFKSKKDIPKEIRKHKEKEYPIKLPNWVKIFNKDATIGFEFEGYRFIFNPWGETIVYNNGEAIRKFQTSDLGELLEITGPEDFTTVLFLL